MSRIKVIVNPSAGRGHAGRMAPEIGAALRALGADFSLVHTTATGDAVDLAHRALDDGYDTIVAVGGDGTSNEVINGMMAGANGHPVGTLGCIPGGSGNDFAVMAGAPTDIARACAQIVAGRTRLVDVGHLTIDGRLHRYFDNAVGIGFDGWVTRETRKYRFVRGMALYIPVVLKTIFSTMQPFHLTITSDIGTLERDVLMAVVSNGPREGGAFLIDPRARIDDGLFNLTLVQEMSRLSMLGMVPRFLRGTHVGDPRISFHRLRHAVIECREGLFFHVDGEIICDGAHTVEVEVQPASLRVIAPAEEEITNDTNKRTG